MGAHGASWGGSPLLQGVYSAAEHRKAYCSAGHVLGVPPPPSQEVETLPGDLIISCLAFCLVLFLVFPFFVVLPGPDPQPLAAPCSSRTYPMPSECLLRAFDVPAQFWGSRVNNSPFEALGVRQREGTKARRGQGPGPIHGGLQLPSECWDMDTAGAGPPTLAMS